MTPLFLALSAASILSVDGSPTDRPNVVLIYADDVGYGDVGVYGSTMIPTPNIDRLANSGIRFTDGHSSASTCSPSRFSMLTGVHAFRHKVRILAPGSPMVIKPGMLTLPSVFKKAGYETAIIGKWHLGLGSRSKPADWNGDVKPGPLEVGFDYSFLLPSTNDRVPCVYLENHRVVNLDPKDPLYLGRTKPPGFTGTEYPDGKKDRSAMTYYKSSFGHDNSIINGIGRIGYQWGGKAALWNDETMADEFVNQTKKYLAGRDKQKPFFLYFSSQDIHVPRTPHPRFVGKTKLGYRGDAMVQFDWSVGQIMESLKEHGLDQNTMIILSSDNGPTYDNGYKDGATGPNKKTGQGHNAAGPFRGGKSHIYEGGNRVPFIVSWPARIKPKSSKALVSQPDLIASFASLLKIPINADQAIDSRNILPALLGEDEIGLPYMLVEAGRAKALRQGSWKYISNGALYDLATDLSEKNDVSSKYPQKVSSMKKLLDKSITNKSGLRNQ